MGKLKATVKAASKRLDSLLAKQFPDISFSVSEGDDAIRLNKVVVPKEQRGQGIGSKFMETINSYADEAGKPVALTAAGDFGGSKAAQQRFYKRHGFEMNAGKSKDYAFTENMIRRPVDLEPQALDMSQSARMKRAAEQGFDAEKTLYHGTNSDFQEFDSLKMGRTDDGWFGKGFYFSPDPSVANQYANSGQANVMPVKVRAQNPYDWRKHEGRGMSLGTEDERYRKTREIMDAGYDSVDVYEDVIKLPDGGALSDSQWSAYVQSSLDSGTPALPRDMVDKSLRVGVKRDDFVRYFGEELAGLMPVERTLKERVVFDPANIRSTNAAFDPAKKDSANLLAGLGGAAVLGGALAPEEAEASVVSKLARLGYYISPKSAGGATLYKKTGEKIGDFEYIDDALRAASEEANPSLKSGDFVDALARRKDDIDLPDMGYRGGHTAPVDPEYHAPLHEMNKIYPDDIYSRQAQQYYGHGDSKLDKPSFDVINAMRGQPDGMVDMYRAVPLDAADEILPGDWVTTNAKYAQQHGEGLESYKVLQAKTEAKRLFTDGNSPHEFGYSGFATPEILASLAAASAAAASVADFSQRRQQKSDYWAGRRQDLLNLFTGMTSNALDALDMPMKGIHGLTATAGSLAAGNSLNESLMRGADVARQPVEQTAYDLGGYVADKTGSPALGTAMYMGATMGSPI